MCVICVKPAGVPMPALAEIKAMAEANPHGFGFCTSTGKFYKSTDFAIFAERLADVRTDEACVMHFRFATHGSVRNRNCHPFRDGDLFFAHNGVLPYPSVGDRTDSEYAFRNILAPVVREYGLRSPELAAAVDAIIGGSRFAFLRGADVLTFGKWFEMDGCLYSNLTWRYYVNNRRFVYSPTALISKNQLLTAIFDSIKTKSYENNKSRRRRISGLQPSDAQRKRSCYPAGQKDH